MLSFLDLLGSAAAQSAVQSEPSVHFPLATLKPDLHGQGLLPHQLGALDTEKGLEIIKAEPSITRTTRGFFAVVWDTFQTCM